MQIQLVRGQNIVQPTVVMIVSVPSSSRHFLKKNNVTIGFLEVLLGIHVI